MHYLSNKLWFPPIESATQEGIVALGGDLSPTRIMLAYRSGIFPWYDEGQPIIWWSPNPRMVLFPEKFKVSKSLQKIVDREKFEVTFNTSFQEVISNCASTSRKGQAGTWITREMEQAYVRLYELGQAISVEVWLNNELVGGLYGIDLPEKKVFCGESMFSKVSDASKVGFFYLVEYLKDRNYKLIDCQVYTSHLESLGAEEVERTDFIRLLNSYSN